MVKQNLYEMTQITSFPLGSIPITGQFTFTFRLTTQNRPYGVRKIAMLYVIVRQHVMRVRRLLLREARSKNKKESQE